MSLDFSVTYSFRPYNGPGVESAPSGNEYQEHLMGRRKKNVLEVTGSSIKKFFHFIE
jgi:hypothetical protein